jgi:membrane protein
VANRKGRGRGRGKKQRTPLADVMGGAVALLAIAAGLLRRPQSPQNPGSASAVEAKGGRGQLNRARPGGIKGRLYGWGDRFKPFGVVLQMQDRFSELHGNYLAGAITLQAFLSLFPLMLLILSVAGFIVANHNPNLAVEIIKKLGISGAAAGQLSEALAKAAETKGLALGIGTPGLLWSGLALVGALQYAYNSVWQVEARGLKDRLVGAAWLVGAAVVFLASAAVTTVLGFLPGFLWPFSIVITLAANVALWLWTAKLLPNRDIGWRPLLPGAVLGGVGLEVLKIVGRFYVPHAVSHSSALYGSIGVVFAVLAWLFFFGRLIVYSACLNVVLWERRAGTVTAVIEVPDTDMADTTVNRGGQTDRNPDKTRDPVSDAGRDPEPAASR